MRRALLAGCGVLIALALITVLPRSKASNAGGGDEIGGPFSLVDGAGRTVTDGDFRGRFLLIYFGYTHCPDVCPTTLSGLAAGLDRLSAAERARVVPIFITVDPERDTPAVVGDYARAFGPEFIGLTGTQAQLAPVEREFRVYAQRHPLAGGDYAMDHSSVIYVMGPDGKFATVLDDQMAPATMAQRLSQLGA